MVDSIANARTDGSKPVSDVVIERITVTKDGAAS